MIPNYTNTFALRKMNRVAGSPPYRGHTGIRYVSRLKDAKLLPDTELHSHLF